MDDAQQTIGDLNRARTSWHLLQELGPILAQQKANIVADMKNVYKSGEATESKLLACVAGLVALDNLEGKLKSNINMGERAREKLNGS